MGIARVLIVDDERIISLDLAQTLTDLGYVVVGSAVTAEEALGFLETGSPDIVLMDIHLGGKTDGITAALEFRKRSAVPLIFLTAYSEDETIERAKSTGAAGFLVKPVGERELAISIEMALSRHQIENRLRENERWLDATLRSIADGVVTADSEGRILYMNPAAETLLGAAPGGHPVLPVRISDLLTPDPEAPDFNRYRKTGNGPGGEPEMVRALFRRLNGSTVTVEQSCASIAGADGKTVGNVFVIRDISKQLQFQKALEAARAAAEEANRAKSEFLANMSHELRTPLNSIIGLTDLASEMSSDPEQREYLSIISQSSDSLLYLINSLLDFSKIEAGKMELAHTPFNLAEAVEDAVLGLALQASKKNLELSYRIVPGCPTGFLGDRRRIQQIVTNLVNNGIKFTEQGSVRILVEPVGRAPDFEDDGSTTDIAISVVDTGIGISQEEIPLLFNAFTQVDGSSTRVYGGTGLGLVITRRLVELMHGDISVESRAGKGSAFRIRLPLAVCSLMDSQVRYPPLDSDCTAFLASGTGSQTTALRERLEGWGITVRSFTDLGTGISEWLDFYERTPSGNGICILDCESIEEQFCEKLQIHPDPVRLSEKLAVLYGTGCTSEPFLGSLGLNPLTVMKPVREERLYRLVKQLVFGKNQLPARADSQLRPGKPSSWRLRDRTILLAEDDPTSRLIVKILLEKNGSTIVTAESGTEALEVMSRNKVDLVLLDIQMPGLDGYEITRRIRQGLVAEVDPGIPIIALTARALPRDRELAKRAGINEYLTKPVDSLELLRTVDEVYAVRDRSSGRRSAVQADGAGAAVDSIRLCMAELERYIRTQVDARKMYDEMILSRYRVSLNSLGVPEVSDAVLKLMLSLRKNDPGRTSRHVENLLVKLESWTPVPEREMSE